MDLISIERLDEISVELFADALPKLESIQAADELIPFVEWHWLKAAGHGLPLLRAAHRLAGAQRALRQSRAVWSDAMNPKAGFIRVRRDQTDVQNLDWISFLFGFSRAARGSGLSKATANQLTGVVKEMEDNIHWHSARRRSGLVAYLSHESMFEFVVVDSGRGVLASLRDAAEFSYLKDHGTALEIAIGTGNSRFGIGTGRGWGFNDLVVGVANANSLIRLRSGDHLLELDGLSGSEICTRLLPRAHGNGFLIAIQVHSG
jgi:hypothetical protein